MYRFEPRSAVPAETGASAEPEGHTPSPLTVTAERGALPSAVPDNAVWSWSCRALDPFDEYEVVRDDDRAPRVGDVAIFRVESIRNHTRVYTADLARHRFYPGDLFVGVFGNRYATDAFEAEVRGNEALHILTGAGMVGTVLSRHGAIKAPTRISLVGYLADHLRRRINLREKLAPPGLEATPTSDVILVLGTGMNAGKTTTACRLVKSLVAKGHRVASLKITGSLSPRDVIEMQSTGACFVADFSDYGTPSTYLSSQAELRDLFRWMVSDAKDRGAEIIVAEIADGVLQREVRMVLSDPAFGGPVRGVVLAASCASSALWCAEKIRDHGHETLAVTGRVTSSPLFVGELEDEISVPVTGDGDRLAELVLSSVRRPAGAAAQAAAGGGHGS